MNERKTEAIWREEADGHAASKEAGSTSRLAPLLLKAYRTRAFRSICLSLCFRLENGSFYSQTWRKILQRYHGVSVGRYSYGPILTPEILPPGTTVGNYCSVGADLVVLRRNHPLDRLTQHPFFYNSGLGYLKQDTISENSDNPLTIGHDVWIGERVCILAGCKSIGNGAVIAAGSVVTRDVRAYTVVGGVPAKELKKRFDDSIAGEIEESRWWELSLTDLLRFKEWILEEMNIDRATSLRKYLSSDGKY